MLIGARTAAFANGNSEEEMYKELYYAFCKYFTGTGTEDTIVVDCRGGKPGGWLYGNSTQIHNLGIKKAIFNNLQSGNINYGSTFVNSGFEDIELNAIGDQIIYINGMCQNNIFLKIIRFNDATGFWAAQTGAFRNCNSLTDVYFPKMTTATVSTVVSATEARSGTVFHCSDGDITVE